jgi:hypothetical protein
MKKVILFSLFLFLFSLSASSQYEVEWGPVYKSPRSFSVNTKLIGMEGQHYFLLTTNRRDYTLLKYDLNHQLVSKQDIDMKYYDREEVEFDKLIKTSKGTFAYFTQITHLDKRQLLVAKFNNGNFEKMRKVFQYEESVSMLNFKWNLNSDLANSLVISENKNKVAYSNVTTIKDGNKDKIAIAVFNAEMELEWSKLQSLDYKDKQVVIKQTVVDNNGEVYILARVADTNNKIGYEELHLNGLSQFKYKIFHVTEGKMKEININIGADIAPVNAALFCPKGDFTKIIVAGLYADTKKKSHIKGVFYASFNKKDGITNYKNHEISKGQGLGKSFKIGDFFQYSDGTIGFLAEEFYITKRFTSDSKGITKVYYTHYNNNILIPKFDKNGKFLNLQIINKQYSSSNFAITSYATAFNNDKLYLIFNNYNNKGERKKILDISRQIHTDFVVIEKDGKISYNETIFNYNDIGKMFFDIRGFDYKENLLLIRAKKGRKYRYGTIKLK